MNPDARAQKNHGQLPGRIAAYLCGVFILALGIALSVNTGMGVSSGSAFPYVISKISGLTLGTSVIVTYCGYILLQWVLLGKEFKVSSFLQIAVSILFGFFVDFWGAALNGFVLPTYIGGLAQLLVSILLIGVGVTLLVSADIILMPVEGLAQAVATRFSLPFHTGRVVSDCVFVGLSIILALAILRSLVGIREGTVLSALLIGRVVQVASRWIKPFTPPPQSDK